ncbi:LacI family DNA-binding transcriptional regulator [Paenibacillus athensensis]|uniref:HTH lacI-type domain-containing protein n=1 Tax=Paenibacillus athensensis TaxID=1967502 RepID=A0A4Y8PYX4_9BACL|nr:LacI family DNA-binding transcriptional regulator [Paenibacillus athensensis]MCD1260412.1 LacI family DNA-binding transcriptional regulator [Paenibacillus athensensis]
MKLNIKEIAKQAGVSIATVSHVVNKTRYVSPELTEKVMKVINEAEGAPGFLLRNLKTLKSDVLLCLVENLEHVGYISILRGVQAGALRHEYKLAVISPCNKGLVHEYIRLEKPGGLMVIPDPNRAEDVWKLKGLTIPTVVIGQRLHAEGTGGVIIDYRERASQATAHLIKCGHERICWFGRPDSGSMHQQFLAGYEEALWRGGITHDPELVVAVDSLEPINKKGLDALLAGTDRPTAIVCADESITAELLKYMSVMNLKCPDDISLISLAEFAFSELLNPAITTFTHDLAEIGEQSVEKLLAKMNGVADAGKDWLAPSRITVRNSTQCIGRGPLGERSASPDTLQLSPAEIELVRAGSYSAAISFHYSGTSWARLHEKGMKDVFSELGIRILAVMDAHFDPELQNKQHEILLTMHPDLVISIPTDEQRTASSYKEIVRTGTRLVLINNVPEGFEREDYVSCVSVNERENGQSAGRLLGEYMTERQKTKAAFLVHGAPFFATRQRDLAAEQVLTDEFAGIELVAVESFYNEGQVFDTCYELIKRHPEIEGLYVSWEGPAMVVLQALRDLNREDIGVVTADLDVDVALNMAMGGPIKGLSAQRPYDQGRAVALAAANALIGKRVPSFIGVTPSRITVDNLLIGWQDILKERAPAQVVEALKKL